MTAHYSFFRFIWNLFNKRPWHYAGGILSVVILDAVDMIPAILIKEMTNKVQKSPLEIDIASYATILVGCYFLISILRMGWRYLLIIPSRTIERELRQSAFEKILNSDFAQASRLKTGDVVSTLSQDLSNLRMFMGPGVVVFFDSLAYFIYIPITLYYVLGSGALWVLLPFIFLFIAVIVVQKPLDKNYGIVSDTLGDLSQYVFEESQGARFFRAEGLIEIRRKRYELLLSSLFGKQLQISKWELGLDATLQTVIQSSYLIVLILAWQGHGEMASGLGSLTVSLQLLDKLLWPLMSISYFMNLYQGAVTAGKRLKTIEDLPGKVLGTESISSHLSEIEIKNLNLITQDKKSLLQNINLKIKSGEHIALVGSVGSGKTVLLQTLAGLWEKSYLRFDDFTFNKIPYQDLDRTSLWKQLSFIPQTPQIFSRSLAINISPQRRLHHEELWSSLEKADFASDITIFPEGLKTLIGEKGINLSGGQKQRTLISRSFHSGARLFLWDDAISALDPKTEKKVLHNLRLIDPSAILILATHRLSSLKNFDRIVVLEQGQVVKSGTFNDIKRDHILFSMLIKDEEEALKKEGQWIL